MSGMMSTKPGRSPKCRRGVRSERAARKQTASQLSDTHRQLKPTPRARQMSTSHDIHDTKYELVKKKKTQY